jgi:hypothetical protein
MRCTYLWLSVAELGRRHCLSAATPSMHSSPVTTTTEMQAELQGLLIWWRGVDLSLFTLRLPMEYSM